MADLLIVGAAVALTPPSLFIMERLNAASKEAWASLMGSVSQSDKASQTTARTCNPTTVHEADAANPTTGAEKKFGSNHSSTSTASTQ